VKYLSSGTLFLLLTLAGSSVLHAQTNSDNPTAGLDLGQPPPPDITVKVAVYGGREHYVDVTKPVTELLGKPDSFDNTGHTLGIEDPVHGQANYLIIVYDLDGKQHLFTCQNNGEKVSAKIIKAALKLEKTPVPLKVTPPSLPAAPTNSDNPTAGLDVGPPPDLDINVVWALYGGLKNYVDVTRQVSKLLLAKPDNFAPTGATLGIKDPVPAKPNFLIIVFDLYGNRHVFTRQNNGDDVDAKALKAEAKAEEEAGPTQKK
jgi:hypothetical protein